jgi:hypothetical protein
MLFVFQYWTPEMDKWKQKLLNIAAYDASVTNAILVSFVAVNTNYECGFVEGFTTLRKVVITGKT